MPLGDSITKGTGTTPNNGYRKPLYINLTNSGYNIDFVGGETQGDFADPQHEGHAGWHAEEEGTVYDINDQVYGWLVAHPADIVLLHIGTNDISNNGQDANEVSDILNEIDRFSTDIKVILALIINRRLDALSSLRQATTHFNQNIDSMAQSRISAGDDIVIVNMESALDYNITGGDMYDLTHPNDVGYAKMADVWFDTLDSIINPPLITSEPITNATVFRPYSYDVDVDANCYPEPTYALTVWPNGMTIDHNTGMIEWLPAVAGDFNVTVEVSNGQPPDAYQSFVITVDHSIKFDAASSTSSSSDGNTLSWQHTIGGDSKRILVVGVAGEDDDVNDLVISSVEYNDVNMALVEGSSETVSSAGYYMKTELYYLLDANLPSSSGSYTITVIYNGDVSARCGGAISMVNVEQQDREAVATNSNVGQDTISTNIITQTDNAWVVDVVGCGNSGSFLTNADGMTERFDVNSDISAAGSTKPVVSAQETTMSWTFSGANRLAHSVAAFAPASYIIAGYISETNDVPIGGVVILADANGGSDTTDPDGYYEVLVTSGWSGMVTPIKDGYLFAPSKRTYSNVTTDLLSQNYKDASFYDLDDDKSIGWGDMRVISDNWLDIGPDIPGDIYKDEDNIVNFLDFAEFAQVW
jgi:lysophospholipase L1-like esterase